jgi:hypothetical protein
MGTGLDTINLWSTKVNMWRNGGAETRTITSGEVPRPSRKLQRNGDGEKRPDEKGEVSGAGENVRKQCCQKSHDILSFLLDEQSSRKWVSEEEITLFSNQIARNIAYF